MPSKRTPQHVDSDATIRTGKRKRAPSIKAVLQTHGLPDVSEPERAEGRLRATRRRATHRPR
jgi:hypothetical protein